jgi:hypothetical protein
VEKISARSDLPSSISRKVQKDGGGVPLRGNSPRFSAPISFVHTSFDRRSRVDIKSKMISAGGFSFGSISVKWF